MKASPSGGLPTPAPRLWGVFVEAPTSPNQRNLHSTWLVFTDGACNQEDMTGSVGGVIYDPSGSCVSFFGEAVPTAIMEDLFRRSKNPIHELEVLPVLIASLAWGHHFTCAQVVYYIDNESARMAYSRGTGETV